LKRAEKYLKKTHKNPVFMRPAEVLSGIIEAMKLRAELDQLNLDPAAKTQVAAMIQALLDQAKQEADAQLQAKDAEITQRL
jgi:hypothetical protein